ncbi:MAG TPA: hypothetical protein VHO27_02115 [Angustibacter sp.]|nr:hypothetical protein [Angustibacter sp.]
MAFAESITDTVRAIAPACAPFRSRAISKDDGHEGFTVRQHPSEGIPLTVAGQPLLRLAVSYKCTTDGPGHYLAVEESAIKVVADGQSNEPLFRYEYDRNAVDDMPAAHFQVHAHRDAFFHVMSRTGEATRRGKRRARSDTMARLDDLHFPVGGHRFRPCLEDVLEMLVTEFGIDSTPQDRQRLRQGREEWRRKQARAVIRDAPEEAVAILRSLGYSVDLPEGTPQPESNARRLRDF